MSRDDRLIESEVRHRLGLVADPHRWEVSVSNGSVSIVDTLDDPADRHIARATAGVVDVRFPQASHAADLS